jgi:hypothetical protein
MREFCLLYLLCMLPFSTATFFTVCRLLPAGQSLSHLHLSFTRLQEDTQAAGVLLLVLHRFASQGPCSWSSLPRAIAEGPCHNACMLCCRNTALTVCCQI